MGLKIHVYIVVRHMVKVANCWKTRTRSWLDKTVTPDASRSLAVTPAITASTTSGAPSDRR